MGDKEVMRRILGRSGIEVSMLGLGCWAIGGPFWKEGLPVGWGDVDDQASLRAIHRALDLGINFLDTADVYGAGHSEELLGYALKGRRDRVILATKFGQEFDAVTHRVIGDNPDPGYVQKACEASLRRLKTDHIDLYQLHIKELAVELALPLIERLEALVTQGKIRYYGWSTDDPSRAELFASGAHCTAIQFRHNVLEDAPGMVSVCRDHQLAAINRSPLGMGLLTGKFSMDSQLGPDDVRSRRPEFSEGRKTYLEKLARIRSLLTMDGRTLPQGALAWLWARNPLAIPIPGFKTVAQIEENIAALKQGPLSDDQMHQISAILNARPV